MESPHCQTLHTYTYTDGTVSTYSTMDQGEKPPRNGRLNGALYEYDHETAEEQMGGQKP